MSALSHRSGADRVRQWTGNVNATGSVFQGDQIAGGDINITLSTVLPVAQGVLATCGVSDQTFRIIDLQLELLVQSLQQLEHFHERDNLLPHHAAQLSRILRQFSSTVVSLQAVKTAFDDCLASSPCSNTDNITGKVWNLKDEIGQQSFQIQHLLTMITFENQQREIIKIHEIIDSNLRSEDATSIQTFWTAQSTTLEERQCWYTIWKEIKTHFGYSPELFERNRERFFTILRAYALENGLDVKTIPAGPENSLETNVPDIAAQDADSNGPGFVSATQNTQHLEIKSQTKGEDVGSHSDMLGIVSLRNVDYGPTLISEPLNGTNHQLDSALSQVCNSSEPAHSLNASDFSASMFIFEGSPLQQMSTRTDSLTGKRKEPFHAPKATRNHSMRTSVRGTSSNIVSDMSSLRLSGALTDNGTSSPLSESSLRPSATVSLNVSHAIDTGQSWNKQPPPLANHIDRNRQVALQTLTGGATEQVDVDPEQGSVWDAAASGSDAEILDVQPTTSLPLQGSDRFLLDRGAVSPSGLVPTGDEPAHTRDETPSRSNGWPNDAFIATEPRKGPSSQTQTKALTAAKTVRLKLLVVGDNPSMKTGLLVTFAKGGYPEVYIPTVFENYTAPVQLGEVQYDLHLWDTAHQEDYDRLRPLSYPDTDVILLCVSIGRWTEYENARDRWVLEMRHFCLGVPFILVGVKNEMNDDWRENSTVKELGVLTDDGNRLAQEIGAVMYLECDLYTHQGVDNVFFQATKAAIAPRRPSNTRRRRLYRWGRGLLKPLVEADE